MHSYQIRERNESIIVGLSIDVWMEEFHERLHYLREEKTVSLFSSLASYLISPLSREGNLRIDLSSELR